MTSERQRIAERSRSPPTPPLPPSTPGLRTGPRAP